MNFKWNSNFRVEQELFKCKNTKISQIISTKDTKSHANVNQLPELDAFRCKEIDGKSPVDQRSRLISQPVRSKTNGTKNNTKERQMNVLKSPNPYESKKMISRLAGKEKNSWKKGFYIGFYIGFCFQNFRWVEACTDGAIPQEFGFWRANIYRKISSVRNKHLNI